MRKMTSQLIAVLAALFLAVTTAPAMAGQACTTAAPSTVAVQQGLALAGKLRERLDATGAAVAVVGRVGQDLSAHGLRYTHAGLAYRTAPEAPWTVLHKLNRCGTDEASLYRQGLGNFFLDTPFEYRAVIVPLAPAAAAQVLDAVAQGRLSVVDEPRYSLLAYPFADRYQNSNGWLLEALALATAERPLATRAEVQRRLRRTGYGPDVIRVGPLERAGAGLTKANVSFFDHPLAERLSGRYSVVTVESLLHWLDRQGWAGRQEDVAL